MKPAPFDYHAPETVDACVEVLAEFGDEAKVLAGGQSLMPMLALRLARPEHLVDVNRIGGLATVRRDDGVLVVGAMTRHVSLERDPEIGAAVPLLRRVAPHIGHFQIRNRGTVGGSLAHGDPAAELPTVARVLDAEFEVTGTRGTRRIAARDFFETVFTTALQPDELLVSIRFPVWGPGAGFAVQEVSRRHGDFALVGAMVAVELESGRIKRVAIGLTGMGSVPERAEAVEAFDRRRRCRRPRSRRGRRPGGSRPRAVRRRARNRAIPQAGRCRSREPGAHSCDPGGHPCLR